MYKKTHIHFVGIGGIGMSGIAEVLLNQGYSVSGSDAKSSPVTKRLNHLGAQIFFGHDAKNIGMADVVVYSSAVQNNNPEIVYAHEKGVPVIPRAQMLAELMRLTKYGIAIAGSHGKTTTTSLLATVLCEAHFDPTAIIGGKLNAWGSNAKLGRGDFMIVEADESDGSFVRLFPTVAVVTNIDPEHLDHYGSFDAVKKAFYEFCERVPFYGKIIVCGEHIVTRELAKQVTKKCLTYGLSVDNDWCAQNIKYDSAGTQFDVYYKGELFEAIEINLSGEHNVLNTLAVIAVSYEVGVSPKVIKKSLSAFAGVGRRLELILSNPEHVIIDDYAHHPVEIKATLKALRQMHGTKKLTVVFQPHRYTRTRDLFEEFTQSFDGVNQLYILPIYGASETPLPGVTAQSLVDAMSDKSFSPQALSGDECELKEAMKTIFHDSEVFVTLGAGDVTKWGRWLAEEMKYKCEDVLTKKSINS